MLNKKHIIVGISGASGMPIAVELLRVLQREPKIETHLVVSEAGILTLNQETDLRLEEIENLSDYAYDNKNIGAAIASGSFKTDGMIVVPCSMKTVAAIHSGYTDNLLQRAADVMIKEQRKLLLVVRESPFSPIHLRNMYELSKMGVGILPPMVSYYNNPATVEDMTRNIVGRILDIFDIDYEQASRWKGI